jgi:hypothetical protein
VGWPASAGSAAPERARAACVGAAVAAAAWYCLAGSARGLLACAQRRARSAPPGASCKLPWLTCPAALAQGCSDTCMHVARPPCTPTPDPRYCGPQQYAMGGAVQLLLVLFPQAGGLQGRGGWLPCACLPHGLGGTAARAPCHCGCNHRAGIAAGAAEALLYTQHLYIAAAAAAVITGA